MIILKIIVQYKFKIVVESNIKIVFLFNEVVFRYSP